MWYEPLLENGLLPDVAVRAGIRSQLRARLDQQHAAAGSATAELVEELRRGPIATHTDIANQQHYQVPTEFFRRALGPRWKYSSAYWGDNAVDLGEAEEAMLALYVDRARIAGNERILDLGCGWGSLSLYLAQRFPETEIIAVSNSSTQAAHIDACCAERGITNVSVETADINAFVPPGSFDRVLSIEMFEHMNNYRVLLERIAGWLRPGGLLFVHHFAHRELVYPFDADGANEWMAKHFFSGGIMPSADLLERFPEHMRVLDRWMVNGKHYQRTCEAWLAQTTRQRSEILEVFRTAYGAAEARRRFHHWRVFFMACAELFGYRNGSEWFVVHSLLSPSAASAGSARHPMQRTFTTAS